MLFLVLDQQSTHLAYCAVSLVWIHVWDVLSCAAIVHMEVICPNKVSPVLACQNQCLDKESAVIGTLLYTLCENPCILDTSLKVSAPIVTGHCYPRFWKEKGHYYVFCNTVQHSFDESRKLAGVLFHSLNQAVRTILLLGSLCHKLGFGLNIHCEVFLTSTFLVIFPVTSRMMLSSMDICGTTVSTDASMSSNKESKRSPISCTHTRFMEIYYFYSKYHKTT